MNNSLFDLYHNHIRNHIQKLTESQRDECQLELQWILLRRQLRREVECPFDKGVNISFWRCVGRANTK